MTPVESLAWLKARTGQLSNSDGVGTPHRTHGPLSNFAIMTHNGSPNRHAVLKSRGALVESSHAERADQRVAG
ncbi:MAG TPA: hypothetical protein VFP68_01760 [Burkholderiaceae bacterium]|nr:hypothetical protein [Burkholderiaceae bacterium]